jgi:hypothetical protein
MSDVPLHNRIELHLRKLQKCLSSPYLENNSARVADLEGDYRFGALIIRLLNRSPNSSFSWMTTLGELWLARVSRKILVFCGSLPTKLLIGAATVAVLTLYNLHLAPKISAALGVNIDTIDVCLMIISFFIGAMLGVGIIEILNRPLFDKFKYSLSPLIGIMGPAALIEIITNMHPCTDITFIELIRQNNLTIPAIIGFMVMFISSIVYSTLAWTKDKFNWLVYGP